MNLRKPLLALFGDRRIEKGDGDQGIRGVEFVNSWHDPGFD